MTAFTGVVSLAAVALLVAASLLGVGGSEGSVGADDPGSIVFFVSGQPGQGAYGVVDPASGQVDALTGPGVDVPKGALEQDGRSVLLACDPETLEFAADFAANLGICRMDIRSGVTELVVETLSPVAHPVPSPDGTVIVFASGAEADHGLKVTSSSGGEIRSLCDGFCPLFRFFDIAWSPDSTRVAFVATTPGSAGHLPQIYVVTVGESDYTQLTKTRSPELDPAWSPDGRRLAFSSSRTGDGEVWVMNADGSDQQQLTRRDGADVDPVWSPDGDSIVFSRHIDRSWNLAIIPSGGGEPRHIAPAEGSQTVARWLADG